MVSTFFSSVVSKTNQRFYPIGKSQDGLQSVLAAAQNGTKASSRRTLSSKATSATGPNSLSLRDMHQSIQVPSALLLRVIQSVAFPAASWLQTHASEVSDSIDDKKGAVERMNAAYAASVAQAKAFVTAFYSMILKKQGSADAEVKLVLGSLVQDLLLVIFLPEWPAADLVLYQVCLMLVSSLKREDASVDFKCSAIDQLGVIDAELYNMERETEDKPLKWQPKRAVDSQTAANPFEQGEQIACPCMNHEVQDRFMLDCDECHCWFHGDCMGVSQSNLPSVWLCDSCKIRRLLERQQSTTQKRLNMEVSKSKSSDPADLPTTSEQLVPLACLRQIVINYLGRGVYSDDHLSHARACYLVTWLASDLEVARKQVQEAEDKRVASAPLPPAAPVASKAKSKSRSRSKNAAAAEADEDAPAVLAAFDPVRAATEQLDQSGNLGQLLTLSQVVAGDSDQKIHNVLTTHGVLKACSHLGCRQQLVQQLSMLISHLLARIRDPQIKIRARVTNALSAIIKAKPTVLLLPVVQRAVEAQLVDESISVREAALDLIGQYILQRPEVALKYYELVLERVHDSGLAVRRRAIRILQGLYAGRMLGESSSRLYARLCAEVVKRFGETESGVKSQVLAFFQDGWFGSTIALTPVTPADSAGASSSSGSVRHAESIVLEMLQVVASTKELPQTGLPTPDGIPELFKTFLGSYGSKQDQQRALRLCRRYCEIIANRIMQGKLSLTFSFRQEFEKYLSACCGGQQSVIPKFFSNVFDAWKPFVLPTLR